MSLNVMARVQAAQFAASQESGDLAKAEKDAARTAQLKSIDSIKGDKVGAVDQKQIQEKKGFWGTISGAALGIGVGVLAVALAATPIGWVTAAVVAVTAVALLSKAGHGIGHDVLGKVNALKAAAFEKSAALEKIDLQAASDESAEATEAIADAADDAQQIERFSRQLRQQQQALSEEERAS
jgi:hypothetical protein